MAKNLMGRSRPASDPYEIWVAGDWTWKVLKKYQADDTKPFARWFCVVESPFTHGIPDMGDVYASEVMGVATRTFLDPKVGA